MKKLWKLIMRKLTIYEVKNGNLRLVPIAELLIVRGMLILIGFAIAYAAMNDQDEFTRRPSNAPQQNVQSQPRSMYDFNAR